MTVYGIFRILIRKNHQNQRRRSDSRPRGAEATGSFNPGSPVSFGCCNDKRNSKNKRKPGRNIRVMYRVRASSITVTKSTMRTSPSEFNPDFRWHRDGRKKCAKVVKWILCGNMPVPEYNRGVIPTSHRVLGKEECSRIFKPRNGDCQPS